MGTERMVALRFARTVCKHLVKFRAKSCGNGRNGEAFGYPIILYIPLLYSILSIIYRSYYLPIERTRFDVQKMAESLYHFSFVRFNRLKTEEGNDGDSSIAR